MSDGNTRARTALAVVSLLLIGAALGIGADRFLTRTEDPEPTWSQRFHADPVGTLDSALALRPEQREEVAAILNASQEAVNRIWLDTHQGLLGVLDSTIAEIETVLDPEQAARLRTLVTDLYPRGAVDSGRARH